MKISPKYLIINILIIAASILILFFLFNNNFTKSHIIILIVIIILDLILVNLCWTLMDLDVGIHIGKIILEIFIVALLSIIILTDLLALEGIPNIYSSIYILLGSIIVAITGLYLNHKLTEYKEKRKIIRIILALNVTIKENFETSKNYLNDIEHQETTNLKELKIGFWDTFNSSIKDVDLDPKIVQDLLSLKELTLEINQKLKERNELIEQEDLYDIQKQHLNKLNNIDKDLQERIKVFNRDTEKYLKKVPSNI